MTKFSIEYKDFSKQAIAKASGVSLSTVKRFFKGGDVRVSILIKLARLFNCSLEEILKYREEVKK